MAGSESRPRSLAARAPLGTRGPVPLMAAGGGGWDAGRSSTIARPSPPPPAAPIHPPPPPGPPPHPGLRGRGAGAPLGHRALRAGPAAPVDADRLAFHLQVIESPTAARRQRNVVAPTRLRADVR